MTTILQKNCWHLITIVAEDLTAAIPPAQAEAVIPPAPTPAAIRAQIVAAIRLVDLTAVARLALMVAANQVLAMTATIPAEMITITEAVVNRQRLIGIGCSFDEWRGLRQAKNLIFAEYTNDRRRV
jgi:hypothetical protein